MVQQVSICAVGTAIWNATIITNASTASCLVQYIAMPNTRRLQFTELGSAVQRSLKEDPQKPEKKGKVMN